MVACSQNNNPVTDKDFQKGTEGVAVDFNADATPDSVGTDTKFTVSVTARNNGAYASNGVATLITEDKYICITDGTQCATKSEDETYDQRRTKDFAVAGKSVGNPNGGSQSIQFDVMSKGLDPQRTKHGSELLLTSCYLYSTVATDEICIDPRASQPDGERICRTKDIEQSNQGSPLAIKKIETIMVETEDDTIKPEFVVHVEDVGRGAVIHRDSITKACTGATALEDWDKVHVLEFGVGTKYKFPAGEGETEIDCPDTFTLDEGEGKFRCTFTESISKKSPAYITQISAKIEFGYTESESMTIDVERK